MTARPYFPNPFHAARTRQALGENPVGLNDEITAALTGSNKNGAACLPKDHPAISDEGELLDR